MKQVLREFSLAPQTLIVAAVNYEGEVIFDWAAYVGCARAYPLLSAKYVHDYGDKLPVANAALIFPDLPLEKYRP